MKTNKHLTFLLILLLGFYSFAQNVKVEYIIKNDSLPKKERKEFIYLDKDLDISGSKYIGRIKATSKQKNIEPSIVFSKEKAQKKGANAFRFVDFKYENGVSELLIDVYVIDDGIKETNETLFPKGKIFIFGRDNLAKQDHESYKFNKEAKTIQYFHYTIYDFEQPTTISKGSALGTTLNLKPGENNQSVFINFYGFGASPNMMYSGGIGVSFSGGSIIHMDRNYGMLLTRIYQKEE